MVPPLPLNSVTAAFRAVYLSPVGASALGWLGSESHLTRDELWFALQRKKPSSPGSPCTGTFPLKGREPELEGSGLMAPVHQRLNYTVVFVLV